MKYVKEFGIILIVSLVGELLNYFLPLPVPASIYGLALMFLCLMLGIIKQKKHTKYRYPSGQIIIN